MKKWLCALSAFFVFLSAGAQTGDDDYTNPGDTLPRKNKKAFADRLVIGGGLGASFGAVTFVQIAPQVGYRVTEKWVNGVGLNYMYFNAQNVPQSIYGASVWTRYFLYEGLFLGGEFEMLNREVFEPFVGYRRRNIPICMVGGGYYSGGGGLGVGIQLMYDIIGDPWSPYRNPILRGGILVGL